MPPLPSDLRRVLENAVIAAREEATTAAAAALKRLAVGVKEFPNYLTADERLLRQKLRAAARQLGDLWNADKQVFATLNKLTHEVAYEHWHRMLFARFLAENNLLIHPEHGVSVDLATVAELAGEEAAKTGTKADTWATAGRYAAAMLPQIFRPDDPALAVQLAPEHQQALEQMLESLPAAVFTADDALGWVYQFWQSAEKERVNKGVKGGDKITGETLPAVTQLFTEHYMVLFLLHNTVGAWHAAKQMTTWSKDKLAACETEADCRAAVALPGYSFDFLRFVKDESTGAWRPAAGVFSGWPRAAKDLKVLDPCCGSGHFLVAALELLARLRMAEENLDAKAAALAVIEGNLFGLELDARCTQIAAFNVAQAAWRLADEHFLIPELHIACAGLGPSATLEQWMKLADKSTKAWEGIPTHARSAVTNGLTNLHQLFSSAPDLGSLIDPSQLPSDMYAADWETMQPFLARALTSEKDDDAHERAVAAQGMAKAAEILSGEFTLVITNVPYLGRGGQGDVLKAFAETHYPEAKADLATVFVSRILAWLSAGGTTAVVTPQNWLFLTSYKKLRERLLKQRTWNMVARLGPGAFETIGGHVVNVALVTITGEKPAADSIMAGVDASMAATPAEKASLLRGVPINSAGLARDPASDGDNADFPSSGRTDEAAGGVFAGTIRANEGSKTPIVGTGGAHADTKTVFAGTNGANVGTKTPNPGTFGAKVGTKTPSAGTNGASEPALKASADAESDPTDAAATEEDAETGDGDAEGVTADGTIKLVPQAEQLKNPDARIALGRESSTRTMLQEHAYSAQGIGTTDNPRFVQQFWEQPSLPQGWEFFQTAAPASAVYSGYSSIFAWGGSGSPYFTQIEALKGENRIGGGWQAGSIAWGRPGLTVNVTSEKVVTVFSKGKFDTTVGAVVARESANLAAIFAFMSSQQYIAELRRIDQALSVTEATLVKVPFDLAHWQKVAAEKYPHGLPEPQSNDPTQWLFHGHPAGMLERGDAREPNPAAVLQVAVARLVGYTWPAELDQEMRLAPEARAWVERCKDLEKEVDDDGVVPLVNINKERPGHERVRALLEAAFGERWTPGLLNDLLAAAGAAGKSLDEWLRGGDFWAQHCAVFHQRPFVWQIWDGKKDGFNVLVEYHRLAEGNGGGHKLLQKITYTYLGDWITQQQAAAKRGEPGADGRLKAAQDLQAKLEAIIEGEPPYDIFVRWKPLHEQPIGWHPDINDGVRVNIRPFVTAGVLRGKVNVKWTKDRGKEPESIRPRGEFPWFWSCPEDEPPVNYEAKDDAKFTGVRLNDLHYTRTAKDEARALERNRKGAL